MSLKSSVLNCSKITVLYWPIFLGNMIFTVSIPSNSAFLYLVDRCSLYTFLKEKGTVRKKKVSLSKFVCFNFDYISWCNIAHLKRRYSLILGTHITGIFLVQKSPLLVYPFMSKIGSRTNDQRITFRLMTLKLPITAMMQSNFSRGCSIINFKENYFWTKCQNSSAYWRL